MSFGDQLWFNFLLLTRFSQISESDSENDYDWLGEYTQMQWQSFALVF